MENTFPNAKQIVGSHACGPVCLLNIYTFFKMSLTLEAILKELNVTATEATHLPQLARSCHIHGLDTIILSSNPHVTAPSWDTKTKEETITLLKAWVTHNHQDGWLKEALFILFYLQEGGNLKILDLSTKILDEYLDKGYILLSCLEESWLWGKRKLDGKSEYDDIRGHTRGHFVVIYGKERDKYLISDPYPTGIKEKEGLYKIDKQKFLVSTLVWNQEILAIKNQSDDKST